MYSVNIWSLFSLNLPWVIHVPLPKFIETYIIFFYPSMLLKWFYNWSLFRVEFSFWLIHISFNTTSKNIHENIYYLISLHCNRLVIDLAVYSFTLFNALNTAVQSHCTVSENVNLFGTAFIGNESDSPWLICRLLPLAWTALEVFRSTGPN